MLLLLLMLLHKCISFDCVRLTDNRVRCVFIICECVFTLLTTLAQIFFCVEVSLPTFHSRSFSLFNLVFFSSLRPPKYIYTKIQPHDDQKHLSIVDLFPLAPIHTQTFVRSIYNNFTHYKLVFFGCTL